MPKLLSKATKMRKKQRRMMGSKPKMKTKKNSKPTPRSSKARGTEGKEKVKKERKVPKEGNVIRQKRSNCDSTRRRSTGIILMKAEQLSEAFDQLRLKD